ncbi:MAG: hypothetical protein WDZ80_06680 [Candidatus Paceibacterota bacterium]
MNKTIWIVILIVLVVLAAWLLMSNTDMPVEDTNTEDTEITENSTSTDEGIEDQLEGLEVEDFEVEFEGIDEDIENLEQ